MTTYSIPDLLWPDDAQAIEASKVISDHAAATLRGLNEKKRDLIQSLGAEPSRLSIMLHADGREDVCVDGVPRLWWNPRQMKTETVRNADGTGWTLKTSIPAGRYPTTPEPQAAGSAQGKARTSSSAR